MAEKRVIMEQELPATEEAAAFMAALDEAEAAANRALNQYERNLTHLRYARIELETAHAIAATSNQRAATLAKR